MRAMMGCVSFSEQYEIRDLTVRARGDAGDEAAFAVADEADRVFADVGTRREVSNHGLSVRREVE